MPDRTLILFSVFSANLIPNLDQDDRIYDGLLTSMATVRGEDALPLSSMLVIWIASIRNGWVLCP